MHNYDFHVPITRISAASWYLEKLIFPISPLDSQSDRSAHTVLDLINDFERGVPVRNSLRMGIL